MIVLVLVAVGLAGVAVVLRMQVLEYRRLSKTYSDALAAVLRVDRSGKPRPPDGGGTQVSREASPTEHLRLVA